jgi:hypothetical protein
LKDDKLVPNVVHLLEGGFWTAGGFSKDFANDIYCYGSMMALFDQQVSKKAENYSFETN